MVFEKSVREVNEYQRNASYKLLEFTSNSPISEQKKQFCKTGFREDNGLFE